jgi:hypothetical protein
VITLINILLSEEAMQGKLYYGKLRDELMMEEDCE